MKEQALKALLADPEFPAELKASFNKATLSSVPARTYIRHCTAQQVIMSDVDRKIRVMGDYILGRSTFLTFVRSGPWVFVHDCVSMQYAIIPSSSKTAGFAVKSEDDGRTLEECLKDKVIYKLNPKKEVVSSYDFVTLQ